MQNNRLITLINTLSKKEIRDFRKFINSPYHNQRADVIQLFESLVTFIFNYQMIPDKPLLYQQVYPDTEFDDQQLRIIISYCFKHLECFLTHEAYFSNKIKTQIKLSQVYRERNLPKHFQTSIKRAKELQHKLPDRNADYYNDNFQILLEQYHFTSSYQRTRAQNLQEISDNIDIAYFTQKLRQTCFSLSHQAVYKTEYHFGMLEETIQYIETQQLLDIPAIAVYYYCYHALTQTGEINYYEKLKQVLFQYANHFPDSEIRDLFLMTINFCIKRLNEGNQRFGKEVLDLYKEGLRQEYLMNNGVLSRFTYQNIATMGLIHKDYDWVGDFIHSYKDRLEKRYRESTYYYNLARLEFARKNYETVLQVLQKADYKDLLLNLDAKTIALKTYYELQEISLLESHMDAMKKFIRRKKIIGYHKENYLNLIRYVKQLLELKRFDKKALLVLQQKIETTKAIAEKVWLLQQLS